MSRMAEAHRVPSAAVDGMDVLAVYEAARRAADQVREGRGPFFLEIRTYRFRPHSAFDPELYRDKAEVEGWKKRDPISALSARLREAGLADDAFLATLEKESAAEIDAAVSFAEEAEWEPVSELTRFTCAEAVP
jgi:TPP-dependent pyruvate/acetoin dehydrogenase alpha subunit